MDSEKMYKDALERAKEIKEIMYPNLSTESCKAVSEYIDAIFPELAESEDERIINAIISFLRMTSLYSSNGCKKPEMIAWLKKQKEPHYTKRNALFDKCVENCDPKTVEEVNKRVDDIMNMPELSPFEQALTNFIGDWEDDEEHWPSQFVKKHGKHILDMAREELQKEQHPSSRFLPNDWVVYDGPLGHAILQIKDVVGGRYSFVDNESTLLVEDSDKFLRPLTSKDVEKPAEWSEEDEETIGTLINYFEGDALDYSTDEMIRRIRALRPSWKPSKEQMEVLLSTQDMVRASGYRQNAKVLASLYEQLKKL